MHSSSRWSSDTTRSGSVLRSQSPGGNGCSPVASAEGSEGLDGRDSATGEADRERVGARGSLAPALRQHSMGSRHAAVSATVCKPGGLTNGI